MPVETAIEPRITMTVQETAAYLGVSDDTVYEMVRRKEIPHIRIRRRILFRRDTLDNWLSRMEAASERRSEEWTITSAAFNST